MSGRGFGSDNERRQSWAGTANCRQVLKRGISRLSTKYASDPLLREKFTDGAGRKREIRSTPYLVERGREPWVAGSQKGRGEGRRGLVKMERRESKNTLTCEMARGSDRPRQGYARERWFHGTIS